jgi:hypothetical protein
LVETVVQDSRVAGQRSLQSCLIIIGVALLAVGMRQLAVSRLDESVQASVTMIQRDPGSEIQDNNYLVYYSFYTIKNVRAFGSYLLEDPKTLGDMPRLGSGLTVSYSTADPDLNRPTDHDSLDLDQVFAAEILLITGGILLLAGVKLH